MTVTLNSTVTMMFTIGTRVFANLGEDGYQPGVIIKQWDEGNPYRIRLDSGEQVRAVFMVFLMHESLLLALRLAGVSLYVWWYGPEVCI
jgi:hypothetical protein